MHNPLFKNLFIFIFFYIYIYILYLYIYILYQMKSLLTMVHSFLVSHFTTFNGPDVGYYRLI